MSLFWRRFQKVSYDWRRGYHGSKVWRTTGQPNRLWTSKNASVIGDGNLHQIFTLPEWRMFHRYSRNTQENNSARIKTNGLGVFVRRPHITCDLSDSEHATRLQKTSHHKTSLLTSVLVRSEIRTWAETFNKTEPVCGLEVNACWEKLSGDTHVCDSSSNPTCDIARSVKD